jgi:purine-binding chemotaxis protein CheW
MQPATPVSARPTARLPLPPGEFRAVIYRAGGFEFATEVSQVQEIVRPTKMARTGALPDYVEGLIKRRGRIVPVVDLRKRLGFKVGPPTPETCAVIVKLPAGPVGFLVDAALELGRLRADTFEIPSAVLAQIDRVYIQAIAHAGNRVLVLLDLQQLLTPSEQDGLSGNLNV